MPINPSISLGARVPDVSGLIPGAINTYNAVRGIRERSEARKADKFKQSEINRILSQPRTGSIEEHYQIGESLMPYSQELAQAQIALGEKKNTRRQEQVEQTKSILLPHSAEFSKFDEDQKAQNFVPWREMMRGQGALIPSHWEGGYTPQLGQEIQMLGAVQPESDRTKSFAEELALIEARGERRVETAEGKQEIKTRADLNKWQKAKLEMDRNKALREWRKLGINEGEFEIKKEDFAQKSDKQKRKELELHKKTKLKNAGVLDEMSQFINLADDLSKTNLSGVTGWGAFRSKFPGKSAATLNKINRLSAMGTIETMAKLKRESPTGSTGFGALSEKELAILENSFAAIKSQKLLPGDLAEELNRISNVMRKYKDRINEFEKKYGDLSPIKQGSSRTNAINSGKKAKPKNADPLGLGI